MKRWMALFALLLCMATVAVTAEEWHDAGQKGCQWSFNEEDGNVLRFKGGPIPDYTYGENIPWYNDPELGIGDSKGTMIWKVSLESGVTEIGSRSLSGLENFRSIEIFGKVTRIGNHAFMNDGVLESISLPDVLEIGEYAFNECYSLHDISLPLVKKINDYAFSGCVHLTTISLPSIETLSENAFASSSLTSVTIHGVTFDLSSDKANQIRLNCTADNTANDVKKLLENAGYSVEIVHDYLETPDQKPSYGVPGWTGGYRCTRCKCWQDGKDHTVPAWTASPEPKCTPTPGPESSINPSETTTPVQTIKPAETPSTTPEPSSESVPVTGITLNLTEHTMYAHSSTPETVQLTAVVFPENATMKRVIWECSDPYLASVSADGLVTLKTKKKSYFTVRASATDGSGVTAECRINVLKKTGKIKKLQLKPKKNVKLKKGQKITLTAVRTPSYLYNNKLKWTSSNKKIAKVSSKGVVTAKKKGTCVITVTATDGSKKSASVKITVK